MPSYEDYPRMKQVRVRAILLSAVPNCSEKHSVSREACCNGLAAGRRFMILAVNARVFSECHHDAAQHHVLNVNRRCKETRPLFSCVG